MRLLVLMYHRARAERHGNSPEMLDAHFAHIAGRIRNVLPGEPLADDRLNVCLSFDDGYFDFYAVVFPLLKKHGLRALLAIPAFYIVEECIVDPAHRSTLDSENAFARPLQGGFCTWRELREMTATEHVVVAAHGFSHVALDQPTAHLPTEIDSAKSILASRLGQPVDSFVFPFGRYSRASLMQARQHYRHVFRIGGAANTSWSQSPLYRVDADAMTGPAAVFSAARQTGYRARYFWNRLRSR